MRLVFLSLLFFLNKAFSTTYYVDALGGNDKNSGKSISSAWKTLHKVNISSFKPGDIISLKAGSRFMLTEPISCKNKTTFNSYGGVERPIVDGGSYHMCVNLDGAENIKFQDLKFVNGYPTNIKLWNCNYIMVESCNVDSSRGANIHNCNIYTGQGSHLTVRNSTLNYGEQITGEGNLGIYLDGTDNSVLEHDTIIGNFSNIRIGFGNAPIYDYTDNLIVRYCVVKNGAFDNIDDDGSRNAQFYYNLFETESGSGYHDNVYIFSDGSGKFRQYSAVGSQYYNNTFITHSRGCAIEVGNGVVATNIIFKNNIFYNTNHSGWMFYSDNTYGSWTFNNNLYYSTNKNYKHFWHVKNSTIPDFISWKTLGYDTNSVCANPLFNNYLVGDYSLKSGSPAMNTGTNVELAEDIKGIPVPTDNPDLGAFQHFHLQ